MLTKDTPATDRIEPKLPVGLRFSKQFGSTCSVASSIVLTPGGTTSCPTTCCSCSCCC